MHGFNFVSIKMDLLKFYEDIGRFAFRCSARTQYPPTIRIVVSSSPDQPGFFSSGTWEGLPTTFQQERICNVEKCLKEKYLSLDF